MNRRVGNRIISLILVLLMACSTVSSTGVTAFAKTSDGNPPIESVDSAASPADSKAAAKVLTYATDEENITDAYLGIALTGGTAFEDGSTLSCHVMDDQERASYAESLQRELDSDKTRTRQVSMVKAFDLGVSAPNHPVQKTSGAPVTVRMYLQNADALSDTALYVRDENQAWHEVPFEVHKSSDGRDGRDEAESKVAHDLPYIECSADQLGTFAFAKVSETDISADKSGTAQEPVHEEKTYAYADARASNPVNNVYWWYDDSKTTLHLSNKAETDAYQLAKYNQPWSEYGEKITQVVLDTEIQPTNTECWFSGCSSLTNLNLGDKFNTSNVTNMWRMFDGCSCLTSLNLGNKFNTSNVTDMSSMFEGCSSLTSLNLGDKFDTSNVTNMYSMFDGCNSLTSLNLGDKFDTSNVTNNMAFMFNKCNSLKSLDLGDKFDTGNVTKMDYMFSGCNSLKSLNLGDKFNTSNVTNMKRMFNGCDALQKLVSQKSGRQDIELPRKMIEQDSPDGVVYSVMPSGSKVLVPFTFSVAESITSTTVVMRKSMDKSFENVPIFEFGVYRENGTLVDTVKNDRDGNIVIEAKNYALGRYYVQEKAGTAANIIYDTSKYYFTVSEVQESVKDVHVTDGNKVTYYTPVEPSLLTGSNLQLSGFSGVTVTDSKGKTHTLRAYCANLSKHIPNGTAKRVYINPTDAEINKARGTVYTGPQKNLSDAIRCILYFQNKDAQGRIWDLFNRGSVIDTSRVNEIPADFQFAIITPPSLDMQPLIVPLADVRTVSTEEITTGIVKKRVVTLETPVSVFKNRTRSKTYVIKQDEDGNNLYGAKLSLWKDGKLVHSFTTTAAAFSAVLADGNYVLREDEAPYGYEKAADISFQVKDHVAYKNGTAVSENTIVMTDKAIRRLATLTVSKKVAGSFGDKHKDFKFCLALDDDSITSLSYMKGDVTETVTRNTDNQFEFTLSDGESAVFADLPVGTGYTVTEPDAMADGYEVTADGATGAIQENGSTVLFTNHRSMVVPTEVDTNMAVFGMILAAGCVLLIGYCLKHRKK